MNNRCDQYEFSNLKNKLGLKIDFYGFLTMIIKLINGVIEEPNINKVFMIMNTDSTATVNFMKLLEFKQPDQMKDLNLKLKNKEISQEHYEMQMTKIQVINLKHLEQLSLIFKLGDWEALQKHVEFRYKIIRNELMTNEAKLKEVVNIVKMKNPSLISQINKAAMISEPYHVRMQERSLNIGGPSGAGGGGYA